MKTYTFKIKVDSDKVVVACHMQLEQFFDSVKMSGMEKLVERYPAAYITACDYEWFNKNNEKRFCSSDYAVSTLKALLDSNDLKSYLLRDDFCGFVGDSDWLKQFSLDIVKLGSQFIENEKKIVDEVKDDELSETE
jgi:hypothetical protein